MWLNHSPVSDVTLMWLNHSLVSDVTTSCLHDYVMWQLVAYMIKSDDNNNIKVVVDVKVRQVKWESDKTIKYK